MTVLATVLVVLGFLLLLAGFACCVIPILPGPVISYLALVVLSLGRGWQTFSVAVLVVLDNVLPLFTARRWGAGKAGIWGSVIGMLVGMLLLPPFGAIVGTFAGAVLGELLFGRKDGNSLKAGWGVFAGTMLAKVVKLAVSGAIAVFYLRAVVRA